jgi:hypothetical protein
MRLRTRGSEASPARRPGCIRAARCSKPTRAAVAVCLC